jgi:hypothetical protein
MGVTPSLVPLPPPLPLPLSSGIRGAMRNTAEDEDPPPPSPSRESATEKNTLSPPPPQRDMESYQEEPALQFEIARREPSAPKSEGPAHTPRKPARRDAARSVRDARA